MDKNTIALMLCVIFSTGLILILLRVLNALLMLWRTHAIRRYMEVCKQRNYWKSMYRCLEHDLDWSKSFKSYLIEQVAEDVVIMRLQKERIAELEGLFVKTDKCISVVKEKNGQEA